MCLFVLSHSLPLGYTLFVPRSPSSFLSGFVPADYPTARVLLSRGSSFVSTSSVEDYSLPSKAPVEGASSPSAILRSTHVNAVQHGGESGNHQACRSGGITSPRDDRPNGMTTSRRVSLSSRHSLSSTRKWSIDGGPPPPGGEEGGGGRFIL